MKALNRELNCGLGGSGGRFVDCLSLFGVLFKFVELLLVKELAD